AQRAALRDTALRADDLAKVFQFKRHAFVQFDDFVEGVGDASVESRELLRQAHGEHAASKGFQCGEQLPLIENIGSMAVFARRSFWRDGVLPGMLDTATVTVPHRRSPDSLRRN